MNQSLSQGGRSGAGGVSTRLRGLLVAAEVALALVLLVGAGLLIRSLRSLMNADPGFQRGNLLTMHIGLRPSKYPNAERAASFCRELLEKVSALPGVKSASLASGLPMQDMTVTSFRIEGTPEPTPGTEPVANVRVVSDEYFRTMMIPVVRGRSFTRQEADDPQSTPIVINEAMARKLWPKEDPLGNALRFDDKHRVVVGVVVNARQLGPEAEIKPEVYMPSRRYTDMKLVVRTANDPTRLTAAISSQVYTLDKDQPVSNVRTMDEALGEWLSERRFVMLLLGTFAGLALLLAALGIYGVLAYSVSQRTRELGIRMALGASTMNVLRLVVGEGLVMTGLGLAVGLVGAFALTRLMEGLIFGVTTTDPMTFALVVAVLIFVALLASYVPARRAARLAPLDALREE